MKKKFGSLAVVCLLMVALAACGQGNKDGTGDTSERAKISENQLDQLYQDPEKMIGQYVELTGQIGYVEKVDQGYEMEMYGDPLNYQKPTVIKYKDSNIQVKIDDWVKVYGKVEGKYADETMYGSSVSIPVIVADTITISNYKDVMSPTIKEVVPENATMTQHGVTLTVNKVEFAENETRVYVEVKNESNEKIFVSTYSAKVTQNGAQHERQSNYDAEYKELADESLPKVTTDGIILFPKLEQSNFDIIFEAYASTNYRMDFEDYHLSIEIK